MIKLKLKDIGASSPKPPINQDGKQEDKKDSNNDQSIDDSSNTAAPQNPERPRIKLTISSSDFSAPGPPKKSKNRIRVQKLKYVGYGYDSEDSDREEDPWIEEEFILRMPPGEDCDYLRKAIENREIGAGADCQIKFKDHRRALVKVNQHLYAAKLVDLPCVIESNKTFDRKSIYKSADICQMLVVGDRIEKEEDVIAVPSKPSDFIWPHGITPPLRYVRKTRFRKRVSNRTIEHVESEVDRLLKLDSEAISTTYEVLDNSNVSRQGSVPASDIGSPAEF